MRKRATARFLYGAGGMNEPISPPTAMDLSRRMEIPEIIATWTIRFDRIAHVWTKSPCSETRPFRHSRLGFFAAIFPTGGRSGRDKSVGVGGRAQGVYRQGGGDGRGQSPGRPRRCRAAKCGEMTLTRRPATDPNKGAAAEPVDWESTKAPTPAK